MSFRTLTCPSCGAPLPPNARRVVVTCAFCHATVSWDRPLVRASAYRASLAAARAEGARGAETITVGDRSYRILHPLPQGASSDLLLAERSMRLTERVVMKRLRVEDDADLLRNEWQVCATLRASGVRGAEHFARLLPAPVARGTSVTGSSAPVPTFVYGFASGFVHSLDDLRDAYPSGLEAAHLVWIWKRILELLAFVHAAGFVHGAILPEHLLVHARDHGVRLVGWSCAGPRGSRFAAVQPSRADYYPVDPERAVLATSVDLAMSARCVRALAGAGSAQLAETPFGRLLDVVADFAEPARLDAAALLHEVSEAAHATFGPPRYVVLSMPASR